MTQTVNGQNQPPHKQGRPGQRQQERFARQARRRRRILIWGSVISALVLIAFGIFGIVKYQQHTDEVNKMKDQQATATASAANATASVVANVTATANAQVTATVVANAMLTATSGSPTPAAGPATPPNVSGDTVKLADGLQYIDVKVGNGPEAKPGTTVYVQYTGWLQSNGQKFDSSYDRHGELFPVQNLGQAQVIPGWNEGLVGMKAGGTRRLIIPPALAYGPKGQGPIPPNATLIFDVTAAIVQ